MLYNLTDTMRPLWHNPHEAPASSGLSTDDALLLFSFSSSQAIAGNWCRLWNDAARHVGTSTYTLTPALLKSTPHPPAEGNAASARRWKFILARAASATYCVVAPTTFGP